MIVKKSFGGRWNGAQGITIVSDGADLLAYATWTVATQTLSVCTVTLVVVGAEPALPVTLPVFTCFIVGTPIFFAAFAYTRNTGFAHGRRRHAIFNTYA